MKIVDISRRLVAGTAVWPGDTPYELVSTLAIAEGESVNLSTLTLSAHTGTHIDAPYHFADLGRQVHELDLHPYWGPAQVVTVQKEAGPLSPEDFAEHDLSLAPRLLVHSAASHVPQNMFPANFVYPSPNLTTYLKQHGIILYGTDCPSMDHEHDRALEGHHALNRNGIAILEWIDLSQVSDGLYELVALPLKILGGDGSPVRAALRTMNPTSGD